MTDRRFYQSIGICPVCHKEPLFGEEKECQKCQTIRYARVIKWRKEHPGYDKNKRKERYHKRLDNHECTYCGQKLDDNYEFKMCPKCLIKSRLSVKRSRERRGVSGI